MYKLKKEYQGVDLHTKGGIIRLDLVKSDEVELKGLQKYFKKSTISIILYDKWNLWTDYTG